jgi:NADH-quinone oxidoreductase subunit E
MPLTEETKARAREIVARYPKARSALLPMLHLVQSEEGYVSPAGVGLCAEVLGLTKAEVGAVATFYTMYKRRPCGDYLVSVCTNLSCQLLGGEDIYRELKAHLGVGHDETTADGTITFEHAECLAACDFAPVVTVNYEFYDYQSPESALALVRALQAGERPRRPGAATCRPSATPRPELAGVGDRERIAREHDPRGSGRAGARQRGDGLMPLTPVLTRRWTLPQSWTIGVYERHDGYARCARRSPCSRTRSSRWSRHPGCAAAAAPASRPARSGASSRRATASRTTWWSTPTRASRARARTRR